MACVQGEEEGQESRQAQEQLEQAQSPLSQQVEALPQQAQAPPVPQKTDPSQALQVSQPCLFGSSMISTLCVTPSFLIKSHHSIHMFSGSTSISVD